MGQVAYLCVRTRTDLISSEAIRACNSIVHTENAETVLTNLVTVFKTEDFVDAGVTAKQILIVVTVASIVSLGAGTIVILKERSCAKREKDRVLSINLEQESCNQKDLVN